MKHLMLFCCLAACVSCSKSEDQPAPQNNALKEVTQTEANSKAEAVQTSTPNRNSAALQKVLDAQSEETKARFQYRNPKETLAFFGVEPGMTVLEVLPGGGWYTQILVPYLAEGGQLIGVDYPVNMWPHFNWSSEEFIAKRKAWPTTWPAEMQEKYAGAKVSAYNFDTLPKSLNESVDMVLFMRAMHNLARFESKGNYLSSALKETFRVLKPGGYVGVVQHQAPEDISDAWADGSKGYLKKSSVIAAFEAEGFTLVKHAAINENPKDVPTEEDMVWRLLPSLSTSKEDEALKAKMTEIGESNRMTLLFQKPDAERR